MLWLLMSLRSSPWENTYWSQALFVWLSDPDARHNVAAYLGAFTINPEIGAARGFFIETMLTFLLVIAIFGSAIMPQHVKKGSPVTEVPGLLAKIPIGFAVCADILAGGLATGACMNPARALGPALVAWAWKETSWIYFTAPFVGGALAGLLYQFVLTPRERSTGLEERTPLIHRPEEGTA